MNTNTITFQAFLLKLSLHTSIIKQNTGCRSPDMQPPRKGLQKTHRKMDQNFTAMAKKFWHIARVAYFMLRKNISKPKFLAELNVILKRGKIAGKSAIHNLMFHHHGSDGDEPGDREVSPDEYEFSCSDTPASAHHTFRLPFRLNKRKRSPSPAREAEDLGDEELFMAAMEIIAAESESAPSPTLSEFRNTSMVRQLRVTDSPFPVMEAEENDGRVDEAAEMFIMKFYRDLKRQNTMAD